VLALSLCYLLGIQDRVIVVFASLLCVTPGLYRGIRLGMHNIAVTVAGALIATVLLSFLPIMYIVVPGGVVVIFMICRFLWWMDYFPLAIITFLYVSFASSTPLWTAGLNRFLTVFLGIAIAMAVNYIFSLFRYRELYRYQLCGVLRSGASLLSSAAVAFGRNDHKGLVKLDHRFHPVFRRIGMFKDEIADLRQELEIRGESGGLSYSAAIWLSRIVDKLEGVMHYLRGVISFAPPLLTSGGVDEAEKKKFDNELEWMAHEMRQAIVGVRDGEAGAISPEVDSGDPTAFELRSAGEESSDAQLPMISLKLSLLHLRREYMDLRRYIHSFLSRREAA
jgi:hypothetical protein